MEKCPKITKISSFPHLKALTSSKKETNVVMKTSSPRCSKFKNNIDDKLKKKAISRININFFLVNKPFNYWVFHRFQFLLNLFTSYSHFKLCGKSKNGLFRGLLHFLMVDKSILAIFSVSSMVECVKFSSVKLWFNR
jgi:hypothetical protein